MGQRVTVTLRIIWRDSLGDILRGRAKSSRCLRQLGSNPHLFAGFADIHSWQEFSGGVAPQIGR